MGDDGTGDGPDAATAPVGCERARSNDIVVGVDGSAEAAAGVRWAWQQARATGRRVRIMHSWTMPSDVDATSPAHRAAAGADARARATHWVHEAIGADASGLRWVLDIIEGPAGPALATGSTDAGLLVLGRGEHNESPGAGSVGQHALTNAVPPVVTVPRGTDARSERTTRDHGGSSTDEDAAAVTRPARTDSASTVSPTYLGR